ncbi:MAG: hypothetical protein OEM59_03795 [Rhodospirillales bacterium]|nr:hypothetical protein [Rhodospirillales bacterium]
MLVAYEVHIYDGGDWQIASMFNERELALMEARRIEEGLRRRETRVVEESHDEDSGRTRTKIIYTTPKLRARETPAPAKPAPAPAQPKKAAPQAAVAERTPTRRRPPAKKSEPSLTVIALTLILIVGLGVAGIVALRYLSNLG